MSWEGFDFKKKIEERRNRQKLDRINEMRDWAEKKINETKSAIERGESFVDFRRFRGVTCKERDMVAGEFIQRNPTVKELFRDGDACDVFWVGFV